MTQMRICMFARVEQPAHSGERVEPGSTGADGGRYGGGRWRVTGALRERSGPETESSPSRALPAAASGRTLPHRSVPRGDL